jgi:phosphatidylethanolamine N-methyltransferase
MFKLIDSFIDLSDPFFSICAFFIALCPILYNVLARLEYFYKGISRFFNGNKKRANEVYSFFMMLVGSIRNLIYYFTLSKQPTFSYGFLNQLVVTTSVFLAAFGLALIIGSSFRLGVGGVYYADYFDIKLDFTVNVFPYNIVKDPLYVGTTLCFFSYALFKGSPAGLILTLGVWLMYLVALRFEDEMMQYIYPKDNSVKKTNVEENNVDQTEKVQK